MMISFFEEYPTDENLAKLELVDFPTKLYIAAGSRDEFEEISKKITSKHVSEVIYWPVLEKGKGYWLSPFVKREELKKVMDDVEGMNIMWDAELPKKRSLILTQFPNFFKNRKMIRDFFNEHKGTIYTAEYFPERGIFSGLLDSLGLSFNPNEYGNFQIKMIYSSMHNYGEYFVREQLACGKKQYGDKFMVGLGTIATGMNGDEPLLFEDTLERDLRIARDVGLEEVIIFRLGGLNRGYKQVLDKFVQSDKHKKPKNA